MPWRNGMSFFLSGVVARWKHALNSLIPVGYQDETGFHFGEPPHNRKKTREPAM